MKDDDDDLGIDLDAWQPPPPPSGTADAVIARVREDKTSQISATPIDAERAAPRRWWVVGAMAAAAGVAALVAMGVKHGPANGHGHSVAAAPMRLAIGPSSAELDRGTEVTWRRERYRVAAQQLGGTATWHVDGDDSFTIDAVLASIEASDANLRVEVQMNSLLGTTDEERERTKKTIATSAITAAAVALVTVVVYDGTVKVVTRDKTVQVPPGTAYQIKGTGPTVIDQEMTVGAAPADLEAKKRELDALLAERQKLLDERQREIDELTAKLDDMKAHQVDPFAPPACDEVSCVLNNYEGTCCAKYDKRRPESLDRRTILDAMGKVKSQVVACGGSYAGTVKARLKVSPDGKVTSVDLTPGDAPPASCASKILMGVSFVATRTGGSFSYPFVFSPQPRPTIEDAVNPFAPGCKDADTTFQKAMEMFSAGNSGAALPLFEEAYHCKGDANTAKLAFAAACKSNQLAKARVYWRTMTPSLKNAVASFCVANGITIDQLDAGGSGPGRLQIATTPAAKVLVDGREVGTTPVDVQVPEGKHKVTFVLGDDKHTFAVTVKAGETVVMRKELP